MNRQFFGTDGIRGPYGGPVINESFFGRLGAAAGRWAGGNGSVVIGWDTRFSGEALAQAAAGGFKSAGLSVRFLGILPTPAVARATRASGAALGVVVTASHNPSSDNGIKFFKTDGRKLTDDEESRIELLMQGWGGERFFF
jgi:phosphoglucosamine mutase